MSDRVLTAAPICGHGHLTAHVAVLDQALAVLMDWYELPPLEAKIQLCAWAVRCDVSACELAGALVNGVCLGRATAGHGAVVRELEQLLRELPGLQASP
ncbi:hypothetical protein EV138_2385 [Kribbella voronezhensis]|uniref:Uncharacterized protein n=1 Tax=Kribbella voronezhensis TaxID=2512212 RepID=A0A4R7TA30_9ACTN|nr:hypothetical protein [Kribbella voronezhensis]TDU88834.1 hypothetical protein EV138_2385 [Kribbella voronezhensis]